jgi:CMP-N-acetylneuraminic acid synthetase
MKISCFLPCRKGSKRVPEKNVKPIGKIDGGLIYLKLQQLKNINDICEIVLSTNDEKVIEIAKNAEISNLVIHKRDNFLCSNTTSTDSLIQLAEKITLFDHIMWTHVTSPFFGPVNYKEAIKMYEKKLIEGYDSLMSVKKIQKFLWNKAGPFNYDRKIEKWPRTQTIKPLFEIDSAIFLNSRENYKKYNDRIGNNPYLYETKGNASFDIDWPEDFKLAELILRYGI